MVPKQLFLKMGKALKIDDSTMILMVFQGLGRARDVPKNKKKRTNTSGPKKHAKPFRDLVVFFNHLIRLLADPRHGGGGRPKGTGIYNPSLISPYGGF